MTTACVTFLPRYASAVSFILVRTMALISSGVCKCMKNALNSQRVKEQEKRVATYEILELVLVLDLDGRLPAFADDFERPVLQISLDVRIIEVAANQT